MLQTIEAVIEPSGAIRLLEEFHVKSPMRAIVTVLDFAQQKEAAVLPGNAAAILQFAQQHPLPAAAKRSGAEIEASIAAERQAWD